MTAAIEELAALERRYAMPTYARAPVEFVRGEGCRLWDGEGNEYLDLFAGLSVHNAGHCHPAIVAAIREQAGLVAGSSNLFYSEPAMRLAERLVESTLGGRAFLCNSGAEANECAIKLVRRHAHERGIEEPEIVVLDHAFHGRTIATLAATPRLAREDLFGPLPAGFVAVPRDDPAALEAAVGERTAAVLLEPVQGESGVHEIGGEVVAAARRACDEAGALLVFDEIQTGMGRTGELWAHRWTAARPDVLTAAKALGGGLPLAELLRDRAGGEHGSTFAGAPIAARAALAALDVIDDESLLAASRERGEQIRAALEPLAGVAELRGRGLMIGVGLAEGLDARRIAAAALAAGVVVNAPNRSTIRLLPPLVIDRAEAEAGVAKLAAAIEAELSRRA